MMFIATTRASGSSMGVQLVGANESRRLMDSGTSFLSLLVEGALVQLKEEGEEDEDDKVGGGALAGVLKLLLPLADLSALALPAAASGASVFEAGFDLSQRLAVLRGLLRLAGARVHQRR